MSTTSEAEQSVATNMSLRPMYIVSITWYFQNNVHRKPIFNPFAHYRKTKVHYTSKGAYDFRLFSYTIFFIVIFFNKEGSLHLLEIYLSEEFRTMPFIVFCSLGNGRDFVEDEALLPMLLVNSCKM